LFSGANGRPSPAFRHKQNPQNWRMFIIHILTGLSPELCINGFSGLADDYLYSLFQIKEDS
jgi:hypothetical protein